MYRDASGALVFGAGTVRWSWGLDGEHDFDSATPNASATPDIRMQQATVNLFADMGVQPGALQAGLVVASATTDTVAPTALITAPIAGATVFQGSPTTISGTASDAGGVVAGVEVSVDGGQSWRRADGRENWSYTWTPTTVGQTTIQARAIDDSGNIQATGATVSVTVSSDLVCPCSIWDALAAPVVAEDPDTRSTEVGVKFRSDAAGYITGLRFYKGLNNGGTHVGSLWAADGTLLARATFTGETASGWQQVSFAAPVAIAADTVYVASYLAPQGRFAGDSNYFANAGVDRGVLHALQDGVSGGNGVYVYTASSAFPTQSTGSANYWVDVVFDTEVAPVLVPDVVNQTQAAAEAAIVAASLLVGSVTTAQSDTVPAGSVISQNPIGGASALPGTAVDAGRLTGRIAGERTGRGGADAECGEPAITAAGLVVGR